MLPNIKWIFLTLLISLGLTLPPDQTALQQTAGTFLKIHQKSDSHQITRCFEILEGTVSLSVMELSPQGYVVLGNSWNLPPVLAYSWRSSFGVLNRLENPLLDLLLSDASRQLDYSSANPEYADACRQEWRLLLTADRNDPQLRFEQWPAPGTTATGGWVESTWNQSAPYNSFCPLDLANGGRSLAGCPAIAIGQIIHYHRQIHNTQFDDSDDYYHNYGGNQYTIDDDYAEYDFPSFPVLNGYLNDIGAVYTEGGNLTSTDKAALVFAAGAAAEQVFGGGVSGTFGVDQAYQAYQRFSYSEAELIYPESNDLFDRIIENIQSGLPVHFAAVTPTWSAGHNFVVDGYNTDGFYHVNFGWSGTYDGWYLLPAELPYDLTVTEGVIVDIIPEQILMPGDLNLDSIVNVQDIIVMVNIVMGMEPTEEQLAAGDLNQDGTLDVLDIICIVNIILGF